jgi:FG-GAP repeat
VAVNGDTVVIGAWLEDIGSNKDQGSVYVFGPN